MTQNRSLPGIDVAGVTRWLAGDAQLAAPLTFTRVGHGQSNLTFLVEDAQSRRVVLRRPPLGPLARGAHDMLREHRLLVGLADQPVPTPRPIAVNEDLAVTGAPVYVMEYVEGVVVHTEASALELATAARARSGLAAAEALAALHAVDADAIGLGDLARRDGYADRQLRGWSRQLEATRTRDVPLAQRVADALSAAAPEQKGTSIVHGDYNLANLILDRDGEVLAVLDWELCTLGDPVADLGTLLCYWPDTPGQAVLERDPVQLLPGFAGRDDVIAAYAAAAPERDLSDLGFWTALATWRLGVILEGVTRRRMQNAANSGTSAEQLRDAADRLFETAAALAGVG